MGWPVHFPHPHTNWAGFFRPRTLQKSYLAMSAARPTDQPSKGPPSPVPGVDCPVPGAPSRHTSPPPQAPRLRSPVNQLAKTLGQLASPGDRPQAPTLPQAASIPGPGPTGHARPCSKTLDQLAGRDRRRRRPFLSARPRPPANWRGLLPVGATPAARGPGSETPLQAPGAAGPVDGRV
jgi:hypothetical protein